MESIADAVFVSAYGRSHWLAVELARKGWRVALVDVSAALGSWEPEDAEGPFGLLVGESLLETQKEDFLSASDTRLLPEGLTLWPAPGPIELGGAMTPFLLRARAIPGEVEAYVRNAAGKGRSEGPRAVRRLPFSEGWLAAFAHSWTGNTMTENHNILEVGEPAPLMAPFYLRRRTAASFEEGLKRLANEGVRVTSGARLRDIRFNGKLPDALEVAADRSGVVKGRAFIWALTSKETAVFTENVSQAIFPEGPARDSWYWTRYRVALKSGAVAEVLPEHVVLLGNPHLPWTHANLVTLVRRQDPAKVDAWIRLPSLYRFKRDYLEKYAAEILEILRARLPGTEPQLVSLPPEALKVEDDLPAPRFPLFEERDLRSLKTRVARNLFYDSPEQWAGYDSGQQYQNQNQIMAGLQRLKQAWDEAALKGASV